MSEFDGMSLICCVKVNGKNERMDKCMGGYRTWKKTQRTMVTEQSGVTISQRNEPHPVFTFCLIVILFDKLQGKIQEYNVVMSMF